MRHLTASLHTISLTVACLTALAPSLANAGYEHRVSLKGLRAAPVATPSDYSFSLLSGALPVAEIAAAYSFNFGAFVSSGDPDFSAADVSFSALSLPGGLSLSPSGTLTGVPSELNQEGATFSVSAQLKGKTVEQTYRLQVVAPADPYFSKVGLLLPLDQSLTDYSPNSSSGISGAPTFEALSPYGSHAIFKGSQLIRVPYAAKMDFSKETDFTLEMRLRLDAPVTGWTSLYTQVEPTGGYRPIAVDLSPTGQLTVSFGNSGLTNWGLSVSAPATLPVGTWQNIAVSKQAEIVRVFVNGTVVASGTYVGALPYWGGDYLIGAGLKNGSQVYPFKGAVDEVRVTRGIARMTGPYIVQPYPFSTR